MERVFGPTLVAILLFVAFFAVVAIWLKAKKK
jgi:hypothetical protein